MIASQTQTLALSCSGIAPDTTAIIPQKPSPAYYDRPFGNTTVMNTFATLFLCFALYACLGWLCESLYCSLPAGKFCNNALLHGPFSPVYGVGAICTVLAAPRWEPSLLLLFMGSVIVNTAVEYATGLLLETCFGRRWWDYSCQSGFDRLFHCGSRHHQCGTSSHAQAGLLKALPQMKRPEYRPFYLWEGNRPRNGPIYGESPTCTDSSRPWR